MAQSEDETVSQPTLLEQMGGLSGLISSTLPILVLVPVNNLWGLTPAMVAAIGVAVAVGIWRLLRKENLQPAISGVFVVLIGAAIAWWTGDAKGYFLYGIWISLIYGIIAVISILVKWPLIGVAWKGINGEGMSWRHDSSVRRAYAWATAGWAVVFFARFVVQNYLYDTAGTTFLAVVRIIMGWPLTGIVTLFTIYMVRCAGKEEREEHGNHSETGEETTKTHV